MYFLFETLKSFALEGLKKLGFDTSDFLELAKYTPLFSVLYIPTFFDVHEGGVQKYHRVTIHQVDDLDENAIDQVERIIKPAYNFRNITLPRLSEQYVDSETSIIIAKNPPPSPKKYWKFDKRRNYARLVFVRGVEGKSSPWIVGKVLETFASLYEKRTKKLRAKIEDAGFSLHDLLKKNYEYLTELTMSFRREIDTLSQKYTEKDHQSTRVWHTLNKKIELTRKILRKYKDPETRVKFKRELDKILTERFGNNYPRQCASKLLVRLPLQTLNDLFEFGTSDSEKIKSAVSNYLNVLTQAEITCPDCNKPRGRHRPVLCKSCGNLEV